MLHKPLALGIELVLQRQSLLVQEQLKQTQHVPVPPLAYISSNLNTSASLGT